MKLLRHAAAAVLATDTLRRNCEAPTALRLFGASRDGWNRIRYGDAAPRFAERLWIDPMRVSHFDRKGTAWSSARVDEGEWSTARERGIEDDPILRSAIARWIDGASWEDTGEIERMEKVILQNGSSHGCSDREDILRRCAQLDEIFRVVERERRLRPHGEVNAGSFREFGGIGIHLGPHGALIRAGNGRHRFAIARILELDRIPVRIGIVHHTALALLPGFRRGE